MKVIDVFLRIEKVEDRQETYIGVRYVPEYDKREKRVKCIEFKDSGHSIFPAALMRDLISNAISKARDIVQE